MEESSNFSGEFVLNFSYHHEHHHVVVWSLKRAASYKITSLEVTRPNQTGYPGYNCSIILYLTRKFMENFLFLMKLRLCRKSNHLDRSFQLTSNLKLKRILIVFQLLRFQPLFLVLLPCSFCYLQG